MNEVTVLHYLIASHVIEGSKTSDSEHIASIKRQYQNFKLSEMRTITLFDFVFNSITDCFFFPRL